VSFSEAGLALIPGSTEALFATSEETTPTVVNLLPHVSSIFLKGAIPLVLDLTDIESKQAVAGALIRQYMGGEFINRHAWISPFYENVAISSPLGVGELPASFIREWPSGIEIPLSLEISRNSQSSNLNRGSLFFMSPGYQRLTARGSLRKEIFLPMPQEWIFRFIENSGFDLEGLNAQIDMFESGRFIQGKLDSAGQMAVSIPTFQGDHQMESASLELSPGFKVYAYAEDFLFPNNAFYFSKDTLPVNGRISGYSDFGRSISVATYPLPLDFEVGELVPDRVEGALPFDELIWAEVNNDGSFILEKGWIGQKTCVLMRDNLSGRICGGKKIFPRERVDLPLPYLGGLLCSIPDGLPNGVELVVRGKESHSVEIKLIPDEEGEVKTRLPPGVYTVFLSRDDRQYLRKRVVVHKGTESQVLFEGIEPMDFQVKAIGSLRGPLPNVSILVPGGGRFITDEAGIASCQTLAENGAASIVVFFPNNLRAELHPVGQEVAVGLREVEVFFEEGILSFDYPDWLTAGFNDAGVLIGESLSFPTFVPFSSTTQTVAVFPAGSYMAFVSSFGPSGGQRSQVEEGQNAR
jgi:hypothetical protein